MNEAPKRTQFKEGFVEPEAPKPVTAEKVPPSAPPPQIDPSPAEQDNPADALPVEQWPMVVQLLHKPIRNNKGEVVHELSFREPRGGDINRYGNPTRLVVDGETISVVIEERKMHYIMAALSDILPPMLDQLDPRDWLTCAYKLRNFFVPDPRGW